MLSLATFTSFFPALKSGFIATLQAQHITAQNPLVRVAIH
jgi:hypothetical protein